MNNIVIGCPLTNDQVNQSFKACGSFHLDSTPTNVRIKLTLSYPGNPGTGATTISFDPGTTGGVWQTPNAVNNATLASLAILCATVHFTTDCSDMPQAYSNPCSGIAIVNAGGRDCTGQCASFVASQDDTDDEAK